MCGKRSLKNMQGNSFAECKTALGCAKFNFSLTVTTYDLLELGTQNMIGS
jgi:hypothetical protein